MSNHFYGVGTEIHEEYDWKSLPTYKKVTVYIFLALVIFTIVLGFTKKFAELGFMTGFDVCALVVTIWIISTDRARKSPILAMFFVLGVITMVLTALLMLEVIELTDIFKLMILSVPFIFIGLGILFLVLDGKNRAILKRCTYQTVATCTTVDIRRVNLFRFDDQFVGGLSPMNYNTVMQPAFLFYINNQPVYVESKYYYGDMNTEFADGKQVTIRVNPLNPTEMIPMTGVNKMLTLFGWLFILTGVFGFGLFALIEALGLAQF